LLPKGKAEMMDKPIQTSGAPGRGAARFRFIGGDVRLLVPENLKSGDQKPILRFRNLSALPYPQSRCLTKLGKLAYYV
jgi:hypothetical protein